MEHDIDIEEHDVLDNPRIKDIFPDLSKVKTEIVEEDDVVTLEEYNPHLQIKQEDFNEDHQDCDAAREVTNNLIRPNVSDTGIGVLNASKNHDQVVLPCEGFDTDNIVNVTVDNDVSICEETQQIAFDNAAAVRNLSVINGSGGNCSNSLVQANEKNSVSTNPMLKKLLQFKSSDPLCNKSKHYNQITAGRTHKYAIHGNSCDIIPNKIILGSKIIPEAPEIQEKEYLPAVVVLRNCGPFLKASSCYCVSCKILFPTENSLDAHNISAHSFLVAFSDREANASIESESDSEIGHFSGRASVSRSNSIKCIDTNDKETNRRVKKRKLSDEVEHSIRSVKSSTNFDNTVSGEQCFHCNKFFTDYSALIKHMYDEVLNKGYSKVKGSPASKSICNFQCQICDESFSNNIVAKFHARFMHPNHIGNVIRTFAAKNEKNGDFDSKGNIHTAKVAKLENNKTNILKIDKIDLIKKQNLEFKYMVGVIIKNPPIPIGVLFKCSKCDLHLITAQGAFSHSTLCSSSKIQNECKKCKRKFQPRDLEMHELQHLVSKSFKVYAFQSNLAKRFVCRCPKCNICFSERLFWQHLLSPCVKTFIHCKKCNLNINRETYMKTGHARCEVHIVIDYYDNVEKPIGKSITDKDSVGDKNGKTNRLWYCENCNMCGRVDFSHNCDKSRKRLCKYCGLYFSPKTIETHKKLHLDETLTLHNFLLFSLKKRRFVQPPIPNDRYCRSCKIYYLNWHICGIKNYKICNICSKKFEKEHYEVHKQFHTYNLDVIVKETIRNGGYVGFKSSLYIFQCVHCKCFIYDYDQTVRHAQNHISRKPQEIKYCEKCDKHFESTSLDIHIFHKHSFTKLNVLNFDFEKLHSDAWFDIFDGLDQVETGNILMDSAYKDTRSLDLSFIQKGDPENTLYVCSSCNIVVEKTALEKHVSNRMYCWENRKYKCNTCDLYFYSPGTMEFHKKLHSNGVKKEDFCIISVNNVDGASLEAATLEERMVIKPPEACTKLVLQRRTCGKKDIWMKRDLADASRLELNSMVSKGNNQSESVVSDSTERDQADGDEDEQYSDSDIKDVSLFKCMDCKACIFSSKYTKKHICNPNYIRYCDNCKQFFYKTKWMKHDLLIHGDMKKINFKLNNFRMKINKAGKRQAYISRVTYILYDKTKVIATERSKKIISDKDVSQIIPVERNDLESDDINTNSQINGRDVMLKKIPNNNVIKDITLYKCTNCKTCIIRKKSISGHWCTIQFYKRFCDYCQQWFSVMNWERHKAVHTKAKVNILIKYFKPEKICYAKRTIKKRRTLKVDNENEKSEITSETSEVDQYVASDDFDDDVQQETGTSEEISSISKSSEVTLYKCMKCKVCILAEKNQKRHKCSKHTERHFCRFCNQAFSKASFKAHMNTFCQDNKNELKIIYFKPTLLKHSKVKASMAMKVDNQNEKNEYMSKIYQRAQNAANDDISDDVQQDRSTSEEISSVSKSSEVKLYKCMNCKVCILAKQNKKRHKCSNVTEQHFCLFCNQAFSKTSFKAHRNTFCQGNKNNLKIIYFKSTIPKHSKVKAMAMKVHSQNEKNEYMSKIFQRARNAANDDVIDDAQQDRSTEEKISNASESAAIKLFKCINCKVCILTKKNQSHHKCNRLTKRQFCRLCNQGFSITSFYAHKRIFCHGNKNHLKIIYFTPSILKNKIKASMTLKAGNKNEKSKCTPKSYETGRNDANDDFSKDDQQSRDTKEKNKSVSKSREIQLFKCTNCKACILNISHQTLHKCNRLTKLQFCRICEQAFTVTSFYVHKRRFCHGNKNNLKIVNFTPAILHSKAAPSISRDNKNERSEYMAAIYKRAQKASACNFSDDIQQDIGIKEKIASDSKSGKIRLFKCINCKVCILNSRNQTQHKCNRVTRIRFCHICKQGFSVASFYIHQKRYCSGNKNNLNIIYFTPSILKHSKTKALIISKAKNTKFTPKIKSILEDKNSTNVNNRRVLKSDNDGRCLTKNSHEILANKTTVATHKNDVEIYRCVHCQTCTRLANQSSHRCLIDIYKQFCDICKEFFPVQNFNRHKKWHRKNKNINLIVRNFEPLKVNYTLTFKHYNNVKNASVASDENTSEDNSSEKETPGPDVEDESINPAPIANLVVSKCLNCKTCIFSKDLDSHICSSDVIQKFCGLCQETFTSNNWNTHNRYHEEYEKINLIIRNFKPKTVKHGNIEKNIESLSFEMTEMNADGVSISEVFDEDTSESFINKRNTSKLKSKKSYSDDEDYKPTRRRRPKVSQKDQTKSESPPNFSYEKYKVYVCAQCDVHFIHKRSCENHSNGRKHVIGILGFEYCRYCKLRFSTRTARKHQPTCPLKYKSGYIRIYDIENNTMRTLNYGETEQDLDVNLATGPPDDEATENKADVPSIDYCEDTNLTNNSNVSNETDITVCTTENSLLNIAERLNESLRYSSQSNMSDDNNTELPKILNMTQEVNTKSYNEDITNDSQTTNASCLQDSDNNTAVENVDLESSNITTKYDENSIRIISEEITNTDAIVVEHNIIESDLNDIPDSESTKDTVNEDSNTESNSPVIPYETKLFSCSVCDVYFLKVECCEAHVTNHTKLDTREYIQCKLCLLQFLVMELHVHIMTHHGDGFKFEEVVIEDFTPNESQPRIYKLRDKLQSLIISTTCTEGE